MLFVQIDQYRIKGGVMALIYAMLLLASHSPLPPSKNYSPRSRFRLPAFPKSTVSINKIFAKVKLLAISAILFCVIFTQSQRRFGDNHTVSSPFVRPLSVPHRNKPRTLLHDVPKVVLSYFNTLEYFPVQLLEGQGTLVAA